MIRVETSARLSFSPKSGYLMPSQPVEANPARGRSLLRYPSAGTGMGNIPLRDGGTADIRTYPFAEGHEDVIALLETPDRQVGWSAAAREAEDDIVLLLKDRRVLPQTMLWMSNGGRYYFPWNSRHSHVLGIEDGCTFVGEGHRASASINALTKRGYPTAVESVGVTEIRYAIGALQKPKGWTEVADIRQTGDLLAISDVGGGTLDIPFAGGWLLGAH